MLKRKKIFFLATIIIIIFCFIVFFIIEKEKTVYRERSSDGNIEIVIQETDYFQPAMMGSREYELTVKKNRVIFKETLLKEQFTFLNDGAGIREKNIKIEWFDDHVFITIDSPEMNAKFFSVDFN